MRSILLNCLRAVLSLFCVFLTVWAVAQSPATGLTEGDLSAKPMQDFPKPAYLATATDPAFGTTLRRISNAAPGETIVPMYSTVQAWNSDESLMILYERGRGHQLLDGTTYAFIRYLDDVSPADVEQIFWSFTDPDIFYYLDSSTKEYRSYSVSAQTFTTVIDLKTLASPCAGGAVNMGNGVKMPSWDNDVIGFRCGNTNSYLYKISTGELTDLNVGNVNYTAAMPAPSGELAHHAGASYSRATGQAVESLNKEVGKFEHSTNGKLSDGSDAYFAVAFAQGPEGGCLSNVVAHDLATGECYNLTPRSEGYPYSRRGTHLSALAHQADPGWLAVSMIGDESGAGIFDQEIILVYADVNDPKVYRVAHHRSDEAEVDGQGVDYWGEPHAVISPSGTRILYGSDWSGSEDGISIDSYVSELPAYTGAPLPSTLLSLSAKPAADGFDCAWSVADEIAVDRYILEGRQTTDEDWQQLGERAAHGGGDYLLDLRNHHPGTYYLRLRTVNLDGSSELSREITVAVSGTESAIRLLTDAGRDQLQAFDEQQQGLVSITRVTQLAGRTMYNSSSGETLVSTLGWPAGVYVLTVATPQGAETIRWVK